MNRVRVFHEEDDVVGMYFIDILCDPFAYVWSHLPMFFSMIWVTLDEFHVKRPHLLIE